MIHSPLYSFLQPHYSLRVWEKSFSWQLEMMLKNAPLTTYSLPQTSAILQNTIPSIFSNYCYNEKKIPFREEVKCTELGHLFEHIVLEYLCISKDKVFKDIQLVEFSGRTSWNWIKEPRGSFHIRIQKKKEDTSLISTPLTQSVALFERILESSVDSKIN
jgi:hypothetical protein